jgi:cytochrome subunit of sulfide dehydrogenase
MHGVARRTLVTGALILALLWVFCWCAPSASAQDADAGTASASDADPDTTSAPAAAASQEGAPPITAFCATCHGVTGPSPFPGVPTIHGLPDIVLENALQDFRDGNRPCRTSECSVLGTCPDIDMCAIASPMSDDEMLALAEWYAAQPFMAHKDPYDPELAERGRRLHDVYCEVCHTRLGSEPLDDAGMLRGQRKVYLRNALEDFREGRRSIGLPGMDYRFKTFGEIDLDALAEFYSGPATYPLAGE